MIMRREIRLNDVWSLLAGNRVSELKETTLNNFISFKFERKIGFGPQSIAHRLWAIKPATSIP
jgi:hypothetical protein